MTGPASDRLAVERRRVRSFVCREGRLTTGQARALETLWPRYGVDPGDAPFDRAALFGRCARVTLEIGFGSGESLARQAEQAPEQDFIGIEVHRPGVGHLLVEMERRGLENIRIFDRDAVEVLERCILPASLDAVQIFFPDPWHKKRHHKRRLIQPDFVRLLASRLRPDGLLHIATDWDDYAAHVQAVMGVEDGGFRPEGPQPLPARPERRPETRFERRGLRLGHRVHDFLFRRRG
ncbi:tRNA (guanine46-N7-)-methyltransferase [Thioalkalivibrio nitratireducens DSM 14787]|uniref:tRNA (guanine-N(7)-)-methyltransferase n=1 Tax=Thioalkalivibrio nitratireducens (strain DSM 14787 / UNIQEM 213 / ALEN2) TaxID=1255043 RepID=L0E3N9_THIND|nr:tRNA (guanosine(46)-N7)-methyltransferase TrmB [Thioalkalivibrio nitratireducens]AGA35286.1 tRNA (guanine46-N7-)-methyltransferase [Thioalkalivibrio nitratireducens DSM 14787]